MVLRRILKDEYDFDRQKLLGKQGIEGAERKSIQKVDRGWGQFKQKHQDFS